MRVLYVNHTAHVSGGERSLLDLLGALPDTVQATVACPPGALQEAVQAIGVPVRAIGGTAGSLRAHPLYTPKAVAELCLSAVQAGRIAHGARSEVLHANSIRAGLILALLPGRRRARVVHVRDCLPPGALSSATLRLIAATATTIVANSSYTAESVRAAAPGARVEVVHNGVDVARFDPARISREAARLRLRSLEGIPTDRPVFGVVAQLSPWKGQDTAIEALALLRERGIDAHLLLIGSAKFVEAATRFDNEAYLRRLHELAARAGLGERVSFMGEREDVKDLLRALDLLLAPSWEEPFGRALIEAMALEVPVLATSVGGPAEIVREGIDGMLLSPRDAGPWADAAAALTQDPGRRERMGRAGRERVLAQFGLDRHAAALTDVYESALQFLAKRDRTS